MKLLIDITEEYYNALKEIPDESLSFDMFIIKYSKPQKMGRWIATENNEMEIDGYYCSCCDLPLETEEKTAYCPNCGCRMMGVEEDE